MHKLLIASVLAFLSLQSNAACQLTEQVIDANQISNNGDYINLGEYPPVSTISTWDGPVKYKSCTVDIGIIERPVLKTSSGYFFVPTFSGSSRIVYLLDLDTCEPVWTSNDFEGGFDITSERIKMSSLELPLDSNCKPVEAISKKTKLR